jgi:hypothetical protein
MLLLLRRYWFRRVMLALVLGTFLPVASATLACQIHCAFEDLGTLEKGYEAAHQDDQAESQSRSGSHLQHAGPCHLAAVPALASNSNYHLAAYQAADWKATALGIPDSFVSPPPEHRPKP